MARAQFSAALADHGHEHHERRHHHDDERGRGRGPRRGRGRGPADQFGFGPGFGPSAGPGYFGRGGRRSKAARGDVRSAVLVLLAEEPMHGYQLMQQISERSDSNWRPSPGSVYPTLQQLEDEGLVLADKAGGKRTFSLTDAGREHVTTNKEQLEQVWDSVRGDASDETDKIREALGALMGAAHMVAQAGTPEQQAETIKVLSDTRRKLFRILAEDEGTES
ncbi:PadR family transcriptional regulator [Pseudonocardiaceae bacterium YIM PH 21723]|nr:PadR family transcriptional regulator [Pseudonocardiaceae bacterium YIM PH 21723]